MSVTDHILAAIYASVFLNKSAEFTKADVVPALARAGLPLTSIQPFLLALGSGNLAAVQKVPGVTPSIIQVGIAQLTNAYARTFKIGMSSWPMDLEFR